MKTKNSPSSLFAGTIILLISNILVKGLGFFYRVILVRLLGAEGIGLVEMVSPLYSFLLVLAGCGVQTALSQIVAGRGKDKRQAYFRTAIRLLFLTGSLTTVAAFALSPLLISYFVPDDRISLCFQVLLPAIFIISIASPWRGYLQGTKQVLPLGLSQNVEQVVRLILGIWLTEKLLAYGISTAVAAASVATVCGELAGFLVLVYWLRKKEKAPLFRLPKRHLATDFFAQSRDLLAYGLPMTGVRLAISGIAMLEAFLIPICLQSAGWDTHSATEIYGRFSGVAMTLLHLPTVFSAALSVSVLPAVAESAVSHTEKKLLEKRVHDSLLATVVFTLPGMMLLFLYAQPLCAGLFQNGAAAEILRWLAPCGIFLYMLGTLASILQGLGAVRQLLVNNLISGALLLAGIIFLTSRPELGIRGTAIAVGLSWICGFLLNRLSVCRATGLKLSLRDLLKKPFLAVLCGLLAYYGAEFSFPALAQKTTATLAPGIVAVVVYLFCIWRFGCLKGLRRQRKDANKQ